MFLSLLRRRNPDFVEAAVRLHQDGAVPPNCFVLDLDAIEQNAGAFAAEADRLGLAAFAMTKQIGRNPDALAAIRRGGIREAVGVDLECGIAAAGAGMRIGHIGHLVQIPFASAAVAASLEPGYWTVFSEQKAREAAAAASALGRVQPVLARIAAEGDTFYPGHEGGFAAADIARVADRLDAIPGIRFAGVTTFPATLFDQDRNRAVATPNRETLRRARIALEGAGRSQVQVNAPGTTSVAVLPALAEAGATQVEPGHGLTGTTPLHAVEDLVERPAIAYVSEVSHLWNGRAYVFGGGLYVDPVLGDQRTSALVVPRGASAADAIPLPVEMPAPSAIDYYATIPLDHGSVVAPGDTVVFGFRPQVFVTRGLTAGISGVSAGAPRAAGTWTANGLTRIDVVGGMADTSEEEL